MEGCVWQACLIIILMMGSEMQQELFRALSNRTRTKPNDIYAKMSAQINALQDQVLLFNHLESQVPQWLRRETNRLGGDPRALSLKLMTQPKYDGLLAQCHLPHGEQPLKNNKLTRKFSQKGNRDPRNSGYGSTSKSFQAFAARSKAQSGTSRPFWGKEESRVKESTMIQTLVQESAAVGNRSGVSGKKMEGKKEEREFNMQLTESIVFPHGDKPKLATMELSRAKPKSLREQIVRKQQVLWSEWEKTERYHRKMGQWMGEAEAEKMLHTMCTNSRVVGVIQKIRGTRPDSSTTGPIRSRHRIKSEQS